MKFNRKTHFKRREDGIITVVFIALLAIMMILVLAESRALIQLRQETKLLAQQQIKRLNGVATPPAASKNDNGNER